MVVKVIQLTSYFCFRYGGSLPNVNQMSGGGSLDVQNSVQGTDLRHFMWHYDTNWQWPNQLKHPSHLLSGELISWLVGQSVTNTFRWGCQFISPCCLSGSCVNLQYAWLQISLSNCWKQAISNTLPEIFGRPCMLLSNFLAIFHGHHSSRRCAIDTNNDASVSLHNPCSQRPTVSGLN